ncbi:MAG: glycosyltransferase family 2 protein [Candidatus Latescibacteria bacterium]|jgi:dolichol-phosphate mannosyltransferase|nr:glycosyltransferase family 2 protein [Candidatus Latescibacterota bacterium]MBT4141452.1 glycosyltransferase family 2 protein [Candidatus Latescibacterota bacterium]MBT5831441.1 glycosyltransferase family 2 protein [Candidatus Latescibacterota bacterium]
MKLSVLIPVHNEATCIETTLQALCAHIEGESIPYEIIVVNDNSTDNTFSVLKAIAQTNTHIQIVNRIPPNGFGLTIREGLDHITGDIVTIVMGDGSDDPQDVVASYHAIQQGYDCVFGSRFLKGSQVTDYPLHKLLLNRLANLFIRILFGLRHNDITNAFKTYRTHVIAGCQPLLAHHFNMTVELPLKAIVRGYTYTTLPIHWRNRQTGISKLKIREMGSRYLFIILYIFLEKWLSKGDYHKQSPQNTNTT